MTILWWKSNNFARKNQDKKENTQCFCPITKNWLQIIEPTETVLNFVTRVSINNETKEAHPIFRILEHRAKSGRPVLRHALKRRLNLLMSQIAGEWSGFCWTESEHRRYAYFVSNERKLRNYRRDNTNEEKIGEEKRTFARFGRGVARCATCALVGQCICAASVSRYSNMRYNK